MKWNDKVIVDISREFLNSNGAEKHIDILASKPLSYKKEVEGDFASNLKALAGDLNICSKRGLSERFDSTIGAGAVTMPFGGKYQRTPVQTMVTKIPVEEKHTDDCSFMSWGYNPFIMEKNPYQGAYLSVVESISKLIAAGAKFEDVYLTFQEYFKKPMKDPRRWGEPLSALLGAFKAQLDYGVAAIGGKDSMSGSFEKLDVPPTLVSFAVTTGNVNEVITNEFKEAGSKVYLLKPAYEENGLPNAESLKALFKKIEDLNAKGLIKSCFTPTLGGVAEAVMKAAIGNGYGFKYSDKLTLNDILGYAYGSFMVETNEELDGLYVGEVTNDSKYVYRSEEVALSDIDALYEGKLESVYPTLEKKDNKIYESFSYERETKAHASKHYDEVRVLIPVFPGTNCEFDSAKAMRDAGATVKIFVINNLNTKNLNKSIMDFAEEVKKSQIIFIPGGFSGGDEPDGSAKFITSFFRNEAIKNAVTDLLDNREGLMLGICNGFQALIKLGLVPYGKIMDTDQTCPTLTFNTIETQVVLPLLESDLLTIMMATTNGTLDKTEVKWSDKSACCVIMASKGYPAHYEKGFEITCEESVKNDIYFAGAKLDGDKLLTNGGRVLGVTSIGECLENVIKASYEKVSKIHFDNSFYRHDIGARALKAKEGK